VTEGKTENANHPQQFGKFGVSTHKEKKKERGVALGSRKEKKASVLFNKTNNGTRKDLGSTMGGGKHDSHESGGHER